MIDIQSIRNEFPILNETMHDKPLCFLDTAASAQKPRCVIDKINEVYTKGYANVHRGAYQISDKATDAFEATRNTVAEFISAKSPRHIVFTKGTTESINLVAQSLKQFYFQEGDEIILSVMEHHANIVPWQMIAEEKGLIIKVIPVLDDGSLDLDAYQALLSDKTKLVSITHISNVLGTINPVEKMIALAKNYNAAVCIDGAQGVIHELVDVQALGCDFYTFSAHKLYGPTGVGVLYVADSFIEKMPPYQGGGNMIESVSFEKTTYAEFPHNFEAGTPNIAGVIAFKEALNFVRAIGLDTIKEHEAKLLEVATRRLNEIEGLKILGTLKSKAAVLTFVIDGIHANDIGMLLDTYGVAVRTGHHCAQPLLVSFQVPSTVRASFGVYNTIKEVNYFADSLVKITKMLKVSV
ncbi:SufS family cysteine desulfurase [Thiotrichales bacterium 19S3-7]|nr:SufS family cysteine desulfurase [Thiotrichales bacterium 19S3-7]MCF6801394.1 SufS family cysteine desulfurase [Thiotrichales bacterium 19S3-11]